MPLIGVRRALIHSKRPAVVTTATTTMDPAFILSSAVSLDASHLVVTAGSGGNNVARSVASHTTGKYYWEVTINAVTNFINGICSATEVNNTYISSDGKSAGIFVGSGWLGSGLSGTTTAPQANVAGHTYGLALDATNKLIWAKDITAASNWNANGTADPATGVNGCNFSGSSDLGTAAIYAAVTCGGAGDQATMNFGATAYAGTKPSGFGNF